MTRDVRDTKETEKEREVKTLETADADDRLYLTREGIALWEQHYRGRYMELSTADEHARRRILFDLLEFDGARINQLLSTSGVFVTSSYIKKYPHRGEDHERVLQELILEGYVGID